jgi:hypothetical protein
MLPYVLATSLSVFAGCAEGGGAPPQTSAEAPASVSIPSFERVAASEPAKPAAASAKEVDEPKENPDGEPTGEAAEASAKEAAAQVPLPEVDIANIGMHIGGEKNTLEQKRPIREAVQKHYEALRKCYADEQKPDAEITFGVDILIDRKGGPAKISNPRSGFGRKSVTNCMVEAFEKIEFPSSGKPMMVSFSLRFRKK